MVARPKIELQPFILENPSGSLRSDSSPAAAYLGSSVSSRREPVAWFSSASAARSQAKPKRTLRIAVHQVVPSGGIQQAVDASLVGVSVEKREHLTLDSEGGAQVTTPKARYLTTAISFALASSSMADHDRDAEFTE